MAVKVTPARVGDKVGERVTEKGIQKSIQKKVAKIALELGDKTRVETRVEIIKIMKENPRVTVGDIAKATGLTIKGVEWNIKDLKQKGLIKRIGPNKGGHWEAVKG
jgi:ATP-dependent DNA helicase RecG